MLREVAGQVPNFLKPGTNGTFSSAPWETGSGRSAPKPVSHSSTAAPTTMIITNTCIPGTKDRQESR